MIDGKVVFSSWASGWRRSLVTVTRSTWVSGLVLSSIFLDIGVVTTAALQMKKMHLRPLMKRK